MNIFKKKGLLWGLMVLLGMIVTAFGFRAIRNGMAVSLFDIYALSIKDFVLIGLIIPGISLLLLKEVNDWMMSSRVLALNSRSIWWFTLSRRLLGNCLISTGIILLPVFLLTNIFMGIRKDFGEWIYMLFLLFTYSMYFYSLALCIAILEIKFHQSLLAVCFVLLTAFLPNLFSFLFRQLEIPKMNGLLNVSYALEEGNFYWQKCVGFCAVLLLLLALLERVGKTLLTKQDIYWK